MDLDDEYDNSYDDMANASHHDSPMRGEANEGGLDPMDIANPVSAYFFLSDDAQDEISGGKKKNMRCRSCGHRFAGEFYDSCPKCYSTNTDEVIAGIDYEDEIAEKPNMKGLDCGHTFVGETYERCPECLSSDTEELVDENDDGHW